VNHDYDSDTFEKQAEGRLATVSQSVTGQTPCRRRRHISELHITGDVLEIDGAGRGLFE